MNWISWMLSAFLLMVYITCLFTVCGVTFQKGRTLLGVVGIFMPLLWIIGAVLPAKPGSRFEVAEQMAYQNRIQHYTG